MIPWEYHAGLLVHLDAPLEGGFTYVLVHRLPFGFYVELATEKERCLQELYLLKKTIIEPTKGLLEGDCLHLSSMRAGGLVKLIEESVKLEFSVRERNPKSSKSNCMLFAQRAGKAMAEDEKKFLESFMRVVEDIKAESGRE